MHYGLTPDQQARVDELFARRAQLPNVDRYDRLAGSVTLSFAVEYNLEDVKRGTKSVLAADHAMPAQARLMDFARHVINYLAVSMAAIDHAFAYVKRYGDNDLGTRISADVRAAADDPLSRFVKDLRNMLSQDIHG